MYQLYVMGGDFLTKEPPRSAVMGPRHNKPARQVSQPRHDYQCDLLTLAPRHSADSPVRDETRLGPDTVGIESQADPPAQRNEVAVVDEHHADAEQLRRKSAAQLRRAAHEVDDVMRQQAAQDHSQRQLQSIVPRPRTAPCQEG